jgi:Tol biopolymer transport system component
MAVVYLAEDLKNHRRVAIKALRPELAAALGADRFLREISIAAGLQHPHILPVHDSGEAAGFLYYVMPYVEGESLRHRLGQEHELPVADAVRILRDVADAMAAAHARGIVHRDIKPENVLLSGRHAVVADFGVARAIDQSAGDRLTSTGVALGTPAYMAPEQAAADPHIDHRADLYAFGVTAYEMLTGQPPFAGRSSQAVLAAHLTETPVAVADRRPSVPAQLAALIMQCLEKRPADRPQSAEELLSMLESVATPGRGITATTPPAVARPGRLRQALIGSGLASALIVVSLIAWQIRHPGTTGITTSDIRPVTSEPGVEFQPVLSPSGKEVAFVAGPIGNQRLVVRSTLDLTGRGELRLADTTLGTVQYPRWSPDGEFVRFLTCSTARCVWKEVGRLGGAVRSLDVPGNDETASWSPDGSRIAFVVGDSIVSVSAAQDRPTVLAVHPHRPPGGIHSLVWSADGRRLAYVAGNSQWLWSANISASSIWMVDATGGEPAPITSDEFLNTSPAWFDDRHLLFVSNRDGPRGVYIVEVGSRGARGEARSVLEASDVHAITYSPASRRLAYAKLTVRQNIWSYPIDQTGPIPIAAGRPLTNGNQVIEEHDLSPDGRWIVYDSNLGGEANIYRQSLGGGVPVQLTDQRGDELGPRWSPDGTEIAFYGASLEIFVIPAEGGTPRRVTNGRGSGVAPRWSPNGLQLAFTPSGFGLRALRFVSRDRIGGLWREPTELRDARCSIGAWSPDGSGVLCGAGSMRTVVSPTGQVVWRRDLRAAYHLRGGPYAGVFSRDGTAIYLFGAHEDGRRGIWKIPLGAGAPRLIVSDDDPGLSFFGQPTVGADRVYATVAAYESDVWVMRLGR